MNLVVQERERERDNLNAKKPSQKERLISRFEWLGNKLARCNLI